MRNNSDTSIAISTENRKLQMITKSLPHQPSVKEQLKCLEKFKKDNLSQVEENYEPSIGMSIDQRFEEINSKREMEQKINFAQNPDGSFRVINSPLIENTHEEKQIYLKGGLNLICLVTKFIRQLKTQSQLSKYKIINDSTLRLIGDLSSSTTIFLQLRDHVFHYNHNMNLNSIFENFISFFEKIPIIEPDNLILVMYKLVVFLMLIINITYLPLEIFLKEETQLASDFSIAFDLVPTIFCIFEIGFKFITSYYDEGILYKNKTKIIKHYLTTDFVVDFLSIFPFFNSDKIVQYLKILRIFKLKYILDNLEEILSFKQSVLGYWEFIKSLFFIIYSCHFFACIWYKIGLMGIENGTTSWIVVKELQNASLINQYCFSLYFIVITTLTIGYGDILPTNINEAIFTIFIAFTGCSVLGLTINNIGEIFKNLNEKNVKYKQQMKNIQQYLKDYQINYNLSLQIRKYFEYHLKAAVEANNEGQILINQLSKQLKEQMQIDLYKKYLIKAQIVKKYCSESTIDKLCQYISIENYAPESQIFRQDQICEKLYYVLEGELEIYVTLGNEKEVCIAEAIKPDQFIGQWEFLISSPHSFCLKAKKLTKLLAISRQDFTKVLKENQNDFESLSQVRDELLCLKKSTGKKCYICGWIHFFTKCPFVFFTANREKIITQATTNIGQERNVKIVIRQYEKKKTFPNVSWLRQAALDYIQEAESNDLTLQYLLDLGFNRNDSLLHGSALYIDELIQNKLSSQIKAQENEDGSNHSFQKSPKVIATYKNRSIILNPAENDSFLNLRLQTNEQLNRQNSQQQHRRLTRELSKVKQSQPRLLMNSTNKIESRMNFMRKNDASNNFQSSNFPSQISSNLNNLTPTNNILTNPQNDQFGSQQGSSYEHHSSIQPQISLSQRQPQQQIQQMLPLNQINMDIDKTFITQNYFENWNLYSIANKIIQQQVIRFQNQFKNASVHKQKSIKLTSGSYLKKKHLLFQSIKRESSLV